MVVVCAGQRSAEQSRAAQSRTGEDKNRTPDSSVAERERNRSINRMGLITTEKRMAGTGWGRPARSIVVQWLFFVFVLREMAF